VVRAYRATSWVLGRVPARPGAALIGLGAQLSYVAWPAKRRWSNANFGHVLGLPPDHPRVRRVALAAYRHYGRYIIELMRLPRMSREMAGGLVRTEDLDAIDEVWKRSPGGLIFVLGHMANVDAVAAGVGARWRVNVVADDSAYKELFDDFKRDREEWGNHVIPWRNLREIYGVLKRREMLALLVDWGYRSDGIPVRMFDAWTTLPAGPATLAAKTRSLILPVLLRRTEDDRFAISWTEPISVTSTDPAELARATQRIADALAASIAAAPEQWYSFKPIWPTTPEEEAELATRAAATGVGRGRAAGGAHADPAEARAGS
jgi:KDO2-lipid IV(A) lauroyltransferase